MSILIRYSNGHRFSLFCSSLWIKTSSSSSYSYAAHGCISGWALFCCLANQFGWKNWAEASSKGECQLWRLSSWAKGKTPSWFLGKGGEVASVFYHGKSHQECPWLHKWNQWNVAQIGPPNKQVMHQVDLSHVCLWWVVGSQHSQTLES